MTATIVDDLTDTTSNKNRECKGQGVANIAAGMLGGMAGCAMIGQSIINVKSGGRTRLSTLCAGIFLLLMVVFLGEWLSKIPDGGIGCRNDHGVHRHLQLGLAAKSERAPVADQHRHGCNGCSGRGDA